MVEHTFDPWISKLVGPIVATQGLVKGTGWGFPFMVPLKQSKIVAQREGADSRAHF